MMAVLLSSLSDAELMTFADVSPSDLTPLESELIKRLRKNVDQIEAQEKKIIELEDRIDELSSEVDDLEEELASR